ncbi:hypothetical protein D3C71_1817810 [compost metagenome]
MLHLGESEASRLHRSWIECLATNQGGVGSIPASRPFVLALTAWRALFPRLFLFETVSGGCSFVGALPRESTQGTLMSLKVDEGRG